jgi:D-glycero-D-manno-heptose 1,7-bisphosphate phosphatase
MVEDTGMRTRPADDERPAIFVLCDGVLSERGGLLARRLDDSALLPTSVEGLHLLSRLNVPIFAVARQQHVSRDARTRAAERASRERVCAALRQRGARVDAMLLMADPATDRERAHDEMERTLRRAARQYAIDLTASYVICDSWPEARAALSVGCQPLLVMTGRGREEISRPQTARVQELTWYAADLMMAALSIDVHLAHACAVLLDHSTLCRTQYVPSGVGMRRQSVG